MAGQTNQTFVNEAIRRGAPLHWVQALRGKSALFTRDEAIRILGLRGERAS